MSVVKGYLNPIMQFTQTPASGWLNGVAIPIALGLGVNLNPGTAADQIDLIGVAKLDFVASTMQTMNLQSMLDIDGGAVNLARVKLIVAQCLSQTDGASLTGTPDGTNGWSTGPFGSGSYKILCASATNPNGGFWIASAPNTTGYTVASGSRVIDWTPSAHAFSAYIAMFGCSV